MLISPEYARLNAELHKEDDYGASAYRWAELVNKIANQMLCDSILDYGAGKQTLGRAMRPKWQVRGYDPAVPEIAALPEPADLVTCLDVLEHIEPDCLQDVLAHIRGLTRKCCFIVVAMRPSIKLLPDGRNAHLIVQPVRWWMAKLMEHFEPRIINVVGGELTFVGKPEC